MATSYDKKKRLRQITFWNVCPWFLYGISNPDIIENCLFLIQQVKGKVHPKKGHEFPELQLYCFFNLGSRWGWVVNATHWPFYLRERDPVTIV
jgi:hypothetical protein